jgi:hypothetical protein
MMRGEIVGVEVVDVGVVVVTSAKAFRGFARLIPRSVRGPDRGTKRDAVVGIDDIVSVVAEPVVTARPEVESRRRGEVPEETGYNNGEHNSNSNTNATLTDDVVQIEVVVEVTVVVVVDIGVGLGGVVVTEVTVVTGAKVGKSEMRLGSPLGAKVGRSAMKLDVIGVVVG